MEGNGEYKNDVFCMLLEDPKNALEIYNGLNNTTYTDSGIVEMKTIKGGISLSVKNDAAFIVGADLNLYEHQSSYNPNMPIRHLIYFMEIIEPYIKNRNLYSRKKIHIPVPHFVVFYNGEENRPESEILRLSDCFERHEDEPELELTCRVYNINPGFNSNLLTKCPVLKEYMFFVEEIRRQVGTGMELENAIDSAIEICLKKGYLQELLSKRRSEVTRMTVYDMTFEAREKYSREEGLEEGLRRGREESLNKLAEHYLKEGTAKTKEEALEMAKSILG